MIGQCRYPGSGQRGGGVLDLGARQAIDDAGVARVAFADEGLELGRRVLLLDDLVTDVGAIETRDETRRAGKSEPGDDFLARHFVGGCRERNARHVGKALRNHGQADIFRAEIMPPLRHAMRLVDRKQRDLGLSEQGEAARRQQSFGRDVEQVEIAGQQPALDFRGLVKRQRRVQHRRVDAGLQQPRDLVAHQRDQRRHHDAAALAQQGRQLIAHRLAAAGRHQHQAVAAVGNVPDDFFLFAAKGRQAEYRIQHRQRVGDVVAGTGCGRRHY